MPLPPDLCLDYIENTADIERLMRWLGERRECLGVDTETTGLLPHNGDRIRLVQFGDETHGWAIDWDQWKGVALEVLTRWTGRMVFHNAPFDVTFLENESNWRADWGRIDDTHVMAHVLDSTLSTGLKQLATRLIDKNASAGSKLLKKVMDEQGWTWATVPAKVPEYWAYSALDPVLTIYLRKELRPLLRPDGALPAYDLELGYLPVAVQMQRNGMRANPSYCHQQIDILEGYLKEVTAWTRHNYGISWGSNASLANKLIEEGVVLEKKTTAGAWAVDKYVLEEIAHPLAATTLKARKARQLSGTYYGNILRYRKSDGIVHPSINTVGARTGRQSISNPSFQNMPKKSRQVRDAFIAREGYDLWSCDSQAIEMRLFAHFSQEQKLIEAIKAGVDLHAYTASLVYHVDKPSDDQRAVAKTFNFARIYGAGLKRLAVTAGITVEAAKAFSDLYNATFPATATFMKYVEQLASDRRMRDGFPYVLTPLGRIERSEPSKAYALVNYLIQGTAAEIMKRQLIGLYHAGLGPHLLLTVHDEALIELPRDASGHTAAEEARRIMESGHDGFLVPIGVEKTGPMQKWGDAIGDKKEPEPIESEPAVA